MTWLARSRRFAVTDQRQNVPSKRWRSVLLVLGAFLFLFSGLLRVDVPSMTGAAWARLVAFVLLVVAAASFSILADRSASGPSDVHGAPDMVGLWGVDGPESRRVRRALRDGSTLREEERQRALARARRRLVRHCGPAWWATPRERWSTLFTASYMAMLWLWFPPSFAAPKLDGWFWALVVAVLLICAAVHLERTGRLPGAPGRAARARQRIAALEKLPTKP